MLERNAPCVRFCIGRLDFVDTAFTTRYKYMLSEE